MKLKLNYIRNCNLFIFINIFILLDYINSEELCKGDSCKSILMKEKIIFIKSSANDNSINLYDFDTKNSSLLGNYTTSGIKRYKSILKINPNEFLIFGLNRENRQNGNYYIFYYDIYSFNENNGNFRISHQFSGARHLTIITLSQLDAKIINESKNLIIYGIVNDFFITYLINLENSSESNYYSYQFPDDEEIDSRVTYEDYSKRNIQCSSLNAINFFCIFYFSSIVGSENYPMFYLNGNFSF